MGVGDGGFSGMMPCLRRISFLQGVRQNSLPIHEMVNYSTTQYLHLDRPLVRQFALQVLTPWLAWCDLLCSVVVYAIEQVLLVYIVEEH